MTGGRPDYFILKYAALLLAKIATIYVFWCVKLYKFFDKFQVWVRFLHNLAPDTFQEEGCFKSNKKT